MLRSYVCMVAMLLLMSLTARAEPAPVAPATGIVYVAQSWDDAVITDARLVELLKKYRAKATFFVDPGNLRNERRQKLWTFNGHDVGRLSIPEVKKLFADFEVGSHTMTHPDLRDLTPSEVMHELTESKRILEEWFGHPVIGFAYPHAKFNDEDKAAVRRAGYAYGRVSHDNPHVFPPADPYEFMPSCHFQDPDFWGEFAYVRKHGGVFYFWGHSYEMLDDAQWQEFEKKLARLSSDPGVKWVTIEELFRAAKPAGSTGSGKP